MAENQELPSNGFSSGPGGFFPKTLPSPALSSTLSQGGPGAGLPHPRPHAIRAGSLLEDKIRRFAESRILHINRRYVKKFGIPEPGDEVVGYVSMAELCRDLEGVIKMIWLSGTPGLQVPYLLRIANELTTWLNSFSPSPAATFSVLRKMDHCFASLLLGQDIETKEPLPGFENGLAGGMTRTDMVRCKSLVMQTRLLIVDVMNRAPDEEEEDEENQAGQSGYTTETDGDVSMGEGSTTASGIDDNATEGGNYGIDDDDDNHMNVARVYENTIVQLGIALGEGPVVDGR